MSDETEVDTSALRVITTAHIGLACATSGANRKSNGAITDSLRRNLNCSVAHLVKLVNARPFSIEENSTFGRATNWATRAQRGGRGSAASASGC